jgi:hypothetical protein
VKCLGRNLADHCCYVDGRPCKFLEENTERGLRWSCQLRRETGSWEAAVTDPRYNDGPDSPGQALRSVTYENCLDYQCRECTALEAGKITEDEFLRLKAL